MRPRRAARSRAPSRWAPVASWAGRRPVTRSWSCCPRISRAVALPAPKTTGKELFHYGYPRAALAEFPGLRPADVLATLTLLTARSVADATRAVRATEVIAAGGGTRDPTLMRMLGAELADVPLRMSDEWGPRRTRRRHTPSPFWAS